MKQKLILVGLVTLSVLYLLEVNFSEITVFNWAAFVIITATFIPILVHYSKYFFKKYKESHKDDEEQNQDDS